MTASIRVTILLFALALTTALAGAQAPDRSGPPAIGEPPELRLPDIVKRRLPNGLSVWLVERHEVPVAQLTLVVEGGSASDPEGQYGVAAITAAMLTEGAGSRSALEIADAIEFLGARLSSGSAIDAAFVRLYTPAASLAEALPIMADVALRPSFPPQELERLRQQRLTSLLQARDDPATIASLALSRVLYGTEHRFGTLTMGTEDTIRGFTPAQLRPTTSPPTVPNGPHFSSSATSPRGSSCRLSRSTSGRGPAAAAPHHHRRRRSLRGARAGRCT